MHIYFQYLLILIVSPIVAAIILIVAVLVALNLGAPILFKQERIGKSGKPFNLYKFRTMINANNLNGEVLDDSLRLTRFGKMLRTTSLDEVPGLWCVLKGEMSLVGPRPLLPEYLPLYTPLQATRHNVLPGITGWAQVNGRNALSWEEKFLFDIWYVENRSFWLDINILVKTIVKVVKRSDVNSKEAETMPRFTGENS